MVRKLEKGGNRLILLFLLIMLTLQFTMEQITRTRRTISRSGGGTNTGTNTGSNRVTTSSANRRPTTNSNNGSTITRTNRSPTTSSNRTPSTSRTSSTRTSTPPSTSSSNVRLTTTAPTPNTSSSSAISRTTRPTTSSSTTRRVSSPSTSSVRETVSAPTVNPDNATPTAIITRTSRPPIGMTSSTGPSASASSSGPPVTPTRSSSDESTAVIGSFPRSFSLSNLPDWHFAPGDPTLDASSQEVTRPTRSPSSFQSIKVNVASIKDVTSFEDDYHGSYLTNGDGYTLYVNIKEKYTIACYKECTKKWPPATISGDSQIMITEEINGKILLSMAGDDKRNQLSYNNYPLYYYIEDVQPGQKKGHGLEGRYFMIGLDGKPLIPNGALADDPDDETRNERIFVGDTALVANTNGLDPLNGQRALSVKGTAKMTIQPDLYTLRFSYSVLNAELMNTFVVMEERRKRMISSLTQNNLLSTHEITFTDQKIRKTSTGKFLLTFYYKLSTPDEHKLSQITEILNNINQEFPNTIVYTLNYSVSTDSINGLKSLLYSLAVNKAFDNAYNVLNPVNLAINKQRPVRNIKVDSNDSTSELGLDQINPLYDPFTKTLFPSFKQINKLTVETTVAVEYNIL